MRIWDMLSPFSSTVSSRKRTINPEDITIDFTRDDVFCHIKALWRGEQIGYVRCILQQDRLHVLDLKVDNSHPIRWPIVHVLICAVGISPRTLNFRSMRIGTSMMKRLIAEADAAGVCQIWGSVMQSDIEATPYLLRWYQQLGFSIAEPDEECEKGAAKKIVRSLAKK